MRKNNIIINTAEKLRLSELLCGIEGTISIIFLALLSTSIFLENYNKMYEKSIFTTQLSFNFNFLAAPKGIA